jgi:serine/threonine protein kinase/flagellar basal body-associated protein FliL
MIGTKISHYRLDQKLGEGTYGEVYRGVHIHDDELVVAIKVIHPNLANDDAFVSGLRKECRLLAKLVHRNIVSFRDLVLSEDHPPAMVLELLEGEDLYSRIKAGPVATAEVVRVLEAMLEGLSAAHQKGVIHRDIKPSNIVLCSDGTVKLLDFGIARAADSSQATKTGLIQGTLDYVAPEVFSGEKATTAADIYATGLVAWEMLTGQVACAEGSLGAKVGWHVGVGAPDVRTVKNDCPDWLADLLGSFLDKDGSSRVQDAPAALVQLQVAKAAAPVVTDKAKLPAEAPPPRTVNLDLSDLRPAEVESKPTSTTGPSTVALPIPVTRQPDKIESVSTPPTKAETRSPEPIVVGKRGPPLQEKRFGRFGYFQMIGTFIVVVALVAAVVALTRHFTLDVDDFDLKPQTLGESPEIQGLVNLGDFNINLRDSAGRILQLEIELETDSAGAARIKEQRSNIRDSITHLCSDYSYAELEGIDGKLRLKDDIHTRVDALLAPHTVRIVYFTKLVVTEPEP